MTNHAHLVIRSNGSQPLSDILRDFKSFSSKCLIKAIIEYPQESRPEWLLEKFWNKSENGYRLWRADNKPIELWSNPVIDQKINYVHMNPVEAGIVFHPEDYVYSSACDYSGRKGYLEVIIA